MQTSNQELGTFGEQLAAEYLLAEGYVILERNWRGKKTELDLIVRDHSTLVFVEVKTRRSLARGLPSEAVTPAKLTNMRRAALEWLAGHRVSHSGIRFDVVSIVLSSANPSLSHIKGID